MNATKKEILALGKELRKKHKESDSKQSFDDQMQAIVLGFENSYKAESGEIGIISKGKNLALWRDIRP